MAISTEKLIPGILPPKEEQGEVDFLKVLDDFDPSGLSQEVLDVFASRNPFITAYGSEESYYYYDGLSMPVPDYPADSRLSIGIHHFQNDREELINRVIKFDAGFPNAYAKCRTALIKAIGSKVCAYIVEKENQTLTPAQIARQKEDYDRFEKYCHEDYERRKQEAEEYDWDYILPASMSEKVVKVRKGVRYNNGRKYFTQRDFAKLIGYSIPKYAAAEKDDALVEDELLDKLIMICHANPYFLYDYDCQADMAEYDEEADGYADAPRVFAGYDVIYKWIREGRPRVTSWIDGENFE